MRAYDPGKIGCYAGWRRYEKNPIIGEQIGEVSDPIDFICTTVIGF